MSRRMRLAELLPDVAGVPHDLAITGLVQDSRAIAPGDAFVAIEGFGAHGLKFVEQAAVAGAAAILFEPPLPDEFAASLRAHTYAQPQARAQAGTDARTQAGACAIAVTGLRARLGTIADKFHGEPSRAMTMVGVTGTNGKTSTVQLLAQAWTLRGRRAGTIGTLGAGLYGDVVPTGFTTPLVLQLHALLAQLRDDGADAVAMEVSSHALDQGRVDGVHFKVAVFSNLTRDHLDYHGTMEAYGAAKAKLFAWPGLESAVINLDDAFGAQLHAQLAQSAPAAGIKTIGVSSRAAVGASVRAEAIAPDLSGLNFQLRIGDEAQPVRSALLGRFNVDNLLAVAGALYALGESPAAIAQTLSALKPVDGRMNRLGGDGAQPLVVIDYAHTPDALEQALTSLRAHAAARLICVFGCGGDRDRGKRPQMAAIAEAHADAVIVTDDNPRGEDGDAIVADILAGFSRSALAQPGRIAVRRDRADAIAAAIAAAGAQDIVLVAGKGHEAYQEIAGVKYPFDDARTARAALEAAA